jgi:hypothetical protein
MLDKQQVSDIILKKDDFSINTFVSSLFEIEMVAHIAHLQTKSYAQHMALNSLYEDIVELRDRFIETYQGKYGIIKGYSVNIKEGQDMVKYITDKMNLAEQTRLKVKDGWLQQIIDDIIELYTQTLYKLKFLS